MGNNYIFVLDILKGYAADNGLDPENIDALFHNRNAVIYTIKEYFYAWETIYKYDPDIFEKDNPDFINALVHEYTRKNLEINENTPKIITNDYRIIEFFLERRVYKILEYITLKQSDCFKLGNVIGEVFKKQFFSYKNMNEMLNINQTYGFNQEVLKGIVYEYPMAFLLMDNEFTSQYYDELKEIFIERLSVVPEVNNRNFRNKTAIEDLDVIRKLAEINKSFINNNIVNLEKIYKTNKQFVIDLFRDFNLSIEVISPEVIKSDPELQKISLKNNPESIENFSKIMDAEIIKYIIDNELYDLAKQISIKAINNPDFRNSVVEEDNPTQEELEVFDEIIGKINECLKRGIKPSNLKDLLMDFAIKEYEKYKMQRAGVLGNVRYALFTTLNSSPDVDSFYYDFPINNYFKEIFGNRYTELTTRYFYHRDDTEAYKEIEDMCRRFGDLFKQRYIKEVYDKSLKDTMINLYVINKNSEVVRKKISEKQQMKTFVDRYRVEDKETVNLVEQAIEKTMSRFKTNYPLTEEEVRDIISKYALSNGTLIEPSRYQDIVKQSEVNKIINRLNSGNINESSKDYLNNQQYIKYRIVNGKKEYYSDYFTFTKDELEECSRYIAYQTVLKLFNGSIMPSVKKIPVDIKDEDLINLELDFNDDNYLFNLSIINYLNIDGTFNIIHSIPELAKYPKEAREKIYELIFNQDLFLLIESRRYLTFNYNDIIVEEFVDRDIDEEHYESLGTIARLIRNLNRLSMVMDLNELKVCNFTKIKKYIEILDSLSDKDIRKLGTRLINMTVDNNAFNLHGLSTTKKLERTNSLYDRMIKKHIFTVPRVSGTKEDINFEVMKQDDPHFLTCGFETDACFRVGGHDNDFLHYCALNKNGFIIKLSDSKGNFLGRASGFRNGNGIYLNQLRTIYDKSGNATKHIPKDIKKKLAEALKACTDRIIEESIKTDEPIDFAVVTHAYSMSEFETNMFGYKLDVRAESLLSQNPVNTQSDDWTEYTKEDGLDRRDNDEDTFSTDYGSYEKVILSRRKVKGKDNTILRREDIKFYDAKAVYTLPKEETKCVYLTEENYDYFNAINEKNAYINGEEYVPLNRDLIGCYVYYTSEWFILEGEDSIIYDSFIHEKGFPDESILAKYTY